MRFTAFNTKTGCREAFQICHDTDDGYYLVSLIEPAKRVSMKYFNDNFGNIVVNQIANYEVPKGHSKLSFLIKKLVEMANEEQKKEETKIEVLASFSFDTCAVGLVKRGDMFYVNNIERKDTKAESTISYSSKDGEAAAGIFFDTVKTICDEQLAD